MRQKAVDAFGVDLTDVAKRSQLTFEGYEEGKVTLDEYLNWVVFYGVGVAPCYGPPAGSMGIVPVLHVVLFREPPGPEYRM